MKKDCNCVKIKQPKAKKMLYFFLLIDSLFPQTLGLIETPIHHSTFRGAPPQGILHIEQEGAFPPSRLVSYLKKEVRSGLAKR